jgi:phosphate-selective porin OprO/OprP
MRSGIVTLIAFAVLLAATAAGGRNLEEILMEKGVIAEKEFKEATAPKATGHQPGKGYTFFSADGNFRLTLCGRGQFWYRYLDRDGANGFAQDVSEWRVRRFKTWMSGYAFTKNLTYLLQLDFANAGNARLLDYAWINYAFAEEAQIQAGQVKIPFLRQEITSDGNLQFVDRANVVDAFKPSTDIGAMAQGKVAKGLFVYNAGVFGGAVQSQVRTGNSNAFAIRGVVNPLGEVAYSEADLENTPAPRLAIGADFFSNTLQKNGRTPFQDASTSAPPYAGTSGWLGMNAAVYDIQQGAGKHSTDDRQARLQAQLSF